MGLVCCLNSSAVPSQFNSSGGQLAEVTLRCHRAVVAQNALTGSFRARPDPNDSSAAAAADPSVASAPPYAAAHALAAAVTLLLFQQQLLSCLSLIG